MYEAPCLRAMHRLMAVQHVKKREVTSFDEITLLFTVRVYPCFVPVRPVIKKHRFED